MRRKALHTAQERDPRPFRNMPLHFLLLAVFCSYVHTIPPIDIAITVVAASDTNGKEE